MEKSRRLVVELPKARRPCQLAPSTAIIVLAVLICLYALSDLCCRHGVRDRAGQQLTRPQSSVFARFPLPNDPFHFLPCTELTVPPSLDDVNPEQSWALLFDPNPAHWNWGSAPSQPSSHDVHPYAGRGIYLCGYLEVPLDYTNRSDSRIVRLAVTKFQVSGLARTAGTADQRRNPLPGTKSERTIVINPGGPGGSGTSMAWRGAESYTHRLSGGRFDILGWDPRGVNMTRPAISCYPYDADRDRWSLRAGAYLQEAASPSMHLEFADAMWHATMRACWEQHGDLPRYMTTAFVARDLEQIRIALDEEDLTAYLVSYGTGIGQTYANMFPNSVGRILLDGTEYVRDHRQLGGFGWTALDNGTDAWRDGFLGECLNAGPEHCALARSKGSNPLALHQLEHRMRLLIESVATRPIPAYTAASGPSLISYSELIGALYGAMYNAQSWPALAQMLFELEEGNSTLAAAFLDANGWEYDPRRPCTPLPKASSDELAYLVICGDSYDAPVPPGGLSWWESLWSNMTTKSWIAGDSRFYTVFPCRHFTEFWPRPAEVYRGDLNLTLRNPVLLIAETYDPATPLRNGRRLAHEMGSNARLVVHHGYGHGSRDTSNCTDAIAQSFVLQGITPGDPETHCYANEKPYLYGSTSMQEGKAPTSQDPIGAWREHIQSMALWAPIFRQRR